MRIGLFTDTYPPQINGVANSTRILRDELEKHGHEVYVFAPKKIGSSEWSKDHKIYYLSGVELKFLYGYVMTSPLHLKAMSEVKHLHLDVIHAQTEFGVGILARMCASQYNIPLVSTYHTTYEDYTHYVNFIKSNKVDSVAKKAVAHLSKMYGDTSQAVIAPSSKTKDLLEKYHVRSDIFVVPTGLPLDKFSPDFTDASKTQAIHQEFGFTPEDKIIVYVGRIAEEKALDLVIDGFVELHQSTTKIKLLVVGDGPDREKLQDYAKQKGISDTVLFAGPRPSEEIADYYRASDAFVSASLSETQGMTFIEALSSGLPLFARKDEVLNDLLIDGKTGWYFEDASSLANALLKFNDLSNEELKDIKNECLEKVHPYSSEVFYERALKVYEYAIEAYENISVIDDVIVKDDSVQIFIHSLSKEEKRLTISLDDYCNYGLRKGGRITESKISELESREERLKAYDSCIRKLAVKDRTRKEMYDWLTKNFKLDIETINEMIETLETKGYINDRRYCDTAINSMRCALFGEEKITRDLRKKGISLEMIEEALNALPNEELDHAKAYADKLQLTIRDESVRMKKEKIRQKLYQRGYKNDVIEIVLQNLDLAVDELKQLDNCRKCAQKARKRYEKKYSGSELRNTIYRYCAAKGYESSDIYAILDEMEWADD